MVKQKVDVDNNSTKPRNDKTFWQIFKDEFHWENLSLNFEIHSESTSKNPEKVLRKFHTSFWSYFDESIVYISYRIFIAVYYSIWLFESIYRNVEYRTTRKYLRHIGKENMLLIHPWQFYMTSWSLTILVIHLWISAFLALYFYSINFDNSKARFFQFLFGSISCSNKIDKYRHKLDSIGWKNSKKINNKTTQTYCDKKHNCLFHSSSICSNKMAWKLWVKAHVPNVILFLIKTSWLLYNLIVQSAIVVTVAYFAYVLIMDLEKEPTLFAEIGNLHRHGLNSLIAIIDIILMAYPVKILHFIYASLYGWSYAFVIFFYWLQDPKKNIIYEQIDYNKYLQISAIYICLTILTFFLQIFHFLAFHLKLYLKKKYFLKTKGF
ncbi:unnamed protein product [Brachionus calyciflorus]|uniref:Rolling stone n=1 Tax=Brachionus calyciflorus TaxID=104777 RepID=A0A814EL53_9BILA|nr:unnamed protein product [Brachionus calyciflorus]